MRPALLRDPEIIEEAGVPYKIHAVDLDKGDQFKPEFLAISPNNRIPGIVDNSSADGGYPPSGVILIYLAEKTTKFKRFARTDRNSQMALWQVGWPWPMAGQNHHFKQYAKSINMRSSAMKTKRNVFSCLEQALGGPHLCGERLFDCRQAAYTWIVPHLKQGQRLEDTPHLKPWFESIKARPATQRAYARAAEISKISIISDEDSHAKFCRKQELICGNV